jgi:hypothetical protein
MADAFAAVPEVFQSGGITTGQQNKRIETKNSIFMKCLNIGIPWIQIVRMMFEKS